MKQRRVALLSSHQYPLCGGRHPLFAGRRPCGDRLLLDRSVLDNGEREMKFACAAVASLVLVAPALADSTRMVGPVTFSCELDGSGDDTFTVYATNSGTTDMQCSATCTYNTATGGQKRYDQSGIGTVRPGKQRFMSGPIKGGEQPPIKEGTLSNLNLAAAYCK